jgi:hypothetical protein
MIRFEPAPKPEGFAELVEKRGSEWLAAHSAGRPHAYWREFLPKLADAFRNLCAYSAMYEPVGTVDHFMSCNEDRTKAYDWSNYRFASQLMNSIKSNLKSHQLIDPFEVQNGWFKILLPSLQLVLTDRVPDEWKDRAQFMLDRLCLGNDERILRQRRKWYELYESEELSLEGLMKMAPLIAAAVKINLRERAHRKIDTT